MIYNWFCLTELVSAAWRVEIGTGQFATDLFVVIILRQPSTAREHEFLTSRRVFDLDVSQMPRRAETLTHHTQIRQ